MKLFEEGELGNITLKNRMGMAAMTRSRAHIDGLVRDWQEQYYAQRASAGFLLTEAINISDDAYGSPFTPGIHTKEQIEAWKKVTTAVHEKGGVIFAQLWHTGRVGHSVDRKGKTPFAPSAILMEGKQHFTSQGLLNFETPKVLTLEEIKQTIKDYGQAAENAIEAGFDGVQLHSANGYLPNQFLAESANQRTDEYGGSVENRTRFVLEVMNELIVSIGGDKVGIKLSPLNNYAGIVLANPIETFTFLINELNKLEFSFIEIMKRESLFEIPEHYPNLDEIEYFGKLSNKTIIANAGYTKESAEEELNKGIAQFVSFGTPYISNPDLVERFKTNAPLNEGDRNTMYGGNDVGYIDYSTL